MKILIGFDFFGAGNLGDDLMLSGFLDACSDHSFELACLSAFPLFSQQRRFRSIRWLPSTPAAREEAIKWCDIWLGLGDSPFQTTSGMQFLDMISTDLKICRRERKPAFFLGTGINDSAALGTPQSREILPSLDFIWTRDQQSYDLLASQLSGPEKLGLGADLANVSLAKFFPQPITANVTSPDAFIINVEETSQLSIEVLERYIADAAESGAPKIRWICQECRKLSISELTIYEDFFSQRTQRRLALGLSDYQMASLADLVAPWKGIRRCLSTRYHGALIAAWAGSAPVAYCRNDKVRGLVEDLALNECVSLKKAEHIESALDSARPVERTVLEKLSRQARDMCHEFLSRSAAISSRPR